MLYAFGPATCLYAPLAEITKSHSTVIISAGFAIRRGQGQRVQLLFRTRRCRCRNSACARKVFAERIPEVAAPRVRETTRLCDIVGLVGYAMGGLPGARLLNRLGIPGSDDLVLRRTAANEERPVRVLGVDDWAWRKG